MFRKIAQFFAFKVFKFSLEGNFPKDPKYVIAVVPHTSNWDFFVAIGVRTFLKETIHFVGKKELFTPLTSWFFKGLGGMPLNRKKNENVVEAITRMYGEEAVFRMAIAPEGTRKKVDEWKTGFYYIAKGAKVPIVMATLDFENKQIKITEPYETTDNKEKDFEYFHSFYKGVKGKHPELS